MLKNQQDMSDKFEAKTRELPRPVAQLFQLPKPWRQAKMEEGAAVYFLDSENGVAATVAIIDGIAEITAHHDRDVYVHVMALLDWFMRCNKK